MGLVVVVVESCAALAAAVRGDRLSSEQVHAAKTGLAPFLDDLHLVDVTESVIESVARFAESESSRGRDAVHLASALLVDAALLASADRDLCEAAERPGLHISNPLHR